MGHPVPHKKIRITYPITAFNDCWNCGYLILVSDILQGSDLLLTHGGHHGHNEILAFTETLLQLYKNDHTS